MYSEIFTLLWTFFVTCFANISSYKAFFRNFFQQEWPWDRAGRFAYHKPYELNKMGDKFFMDFSFFAHRFLKENLWNFFSQMPNDIYILPLWLLLRNQQVVGYSIWIGWLPHWEAWAQFWSTLCSTSQYHCTPAFPFKQLFNRPVQEPIRSQVSSCQVLQWYIRHHKIKIGIQNYNNYCIILRLWCSS